jgi:shikimate kinase
MLGYSFLDIDQEIEKRYASKNEPLSCRQIFLSEGEPYFRAVERACLLALTAESQRVIALGGGSILDASVRAHLRTLGTIIHLKVDCIRLLERMPLPYPPYLDAERPLSSLEWLYQKRYPLYQSIAHHTLDVTSLSIESIAEVIQAMWR